MKENIFVFLLLSALSICPVLAQEASELTAQEQVEGIEQMCMENAAAIEMRQQEESLYSRLGGREGIAEFSSRLYQAHKSNEAIGHMFSNVPEQPFINNVTDFLVFHFGGGGSYSGRNMTDAHMNLGITYEDFLVAGGDVQAVMTELGAGENEIQEVICFLVSNVPQVVTE